MASKESALRLSENASVKSAEKDGKMNSCESLLIKENTAKVNPSDQTTSLTEQHYLVESHEKIAELRSELKKQLQYSTSMLKQKDAQIDRLSKELAGSLSQRNEDRTALSDIQTKTFVELQKANKVLQQEMEFLTKRYEKVDTSRIEAFHMVNTLKKELEYHKDHAHSEMENMKNKFLAEITVLHKEKECLENNSLHFCQKIDSLSKKVSELLRQKEDQTAKYIEAKEHIRKVEAEFSTQTNSMQAKIDHLLAENEKLDEDYKQAHLKKVEAHETCSILKERVFTEAKSFNEEKCQLKVAAGTHINNIEKELEKQSYLLEAKGKTFKEILDKKRIEIQDLEQKIRNAESENKTLKSKIIEISEKSQKKIDALQLALNSEKSVNKYFSLMPSPESNLRIPTKKRNLSDNPALLTSLDTRANTNNSKSSSPRALTYKKCQSLKVAAVPDEGSIEEIFQAGLKTLQSLSITSNESIVAFTQIASVLENNSNKNICFEILFSTSNGQLSIDNNSLGKNTPFHTLIKYAVSTLFLPKFYATSIYNAVAILKNLSNLKQEDGNVRNCIGFNFYGSEVLEIVELQNAVHELLNYSNIKVNKIFEPVIVIETIGNILLSYTAANSLLSAGFLPILISYLNKSEYKAKYQSLRCLKKIIFWVGPDPDVLDSNLAHILMNELNNGMTILRVEVLWIIFMLVRSFECKTKKNKYFRKLFIENDVITGALDILLNNKLPPSCSMDLELISCNQKSLSYSAFAVADNNVKSELVFAALCVLYSITLNIHGKSEVRNQNGTKVLLPFMKGDIDFCFRYVVLNILVNLLAKDDSLKSTNHVLEYISTSINSNSILSSLSCTNLQISNLARRCVCLAISKSLQEYQAGEFVLPVLTIALDAIQLLSIFGHRFDASRDEECVNALQNLVHCCKAHQGWLPKLVIQIFDSVNSSESSKHMFEWLMESSINNSTSQNLRQSSVKLLAILSSCSAACNRLLDIGRERSNNPVISFLKYFYNCFSNHQLAISLSKEFAYAMLTCVTNFASNDVSIIKTLEECSCTQFLNSCIFFLSDDNPEITPCLVEAGLNFLGTMAKFGVYQFNDLSIEITHSLVNIAFDKKTFGRILNKETTDATVIESAFSSGIGKHSQDILLQMDDDQFQYFPLKGTTAILQQARIVMNFNQLALEPVRDYLLWTFKILQTILINGGQVEEVVKDDIINNDLVWVMTQGLILDFPGTLKKSLFDLWKVLTIRKSFRCILLVDDDTYLQCIDIFLDAKLGKDEEFIGVANTVLEYLKRESSSKSTIKSKEATKRKILSKPR